MAVFGAFVSNRDDAFRAVQAACVIRDALVGLNVDLERGFGVRLDIHTGIATGEAVVVAAPGAGARVVGDVVHTAARLQSNAEMHQILVSDATARLVAGGVRMEAVAPLRLKGKRELVTAWRVVELLDGTLQDDLLPLIGRDAELGRLLATYARARQDRRCALVTVLGSVGIGKSRLVREFLAAPAAAGAAVLRGTCQAYGVGLTYRPVAEVVRSLPGGWAEAVSVLEAGHPDARQAIRALSVALELHEEDGCSVGVAEIAWAFRCLVEALGRRGPLIVVFEDLHWAEPTLLSLIGEVVGGTADSEVLVVCTARSETAGPVTAWAGELAASVTSQSVTSQSVVLELDPLTTAQSRVLVALLAEQGEVTAQSAPAATAVRSADRTDEALERIVQECDGNPLFAELLLESPFGDGDVRAEGVPTTVRVLLAAWLDRLPATDREVLERAACVGGTFTLGTSARWRRTRRP